MKSLIKNIKHKLNLCYSIIGLINPRCNINEKLIAPAPEVEVKKGKPKVIITEKFDGGWTAMHCAANNGIYFPRESKEPFYGPLIAKAKE